MGVAHRVENTYYIWVHQKSGAGGGDGHWNKCGTAARIPLRKKILILDLRVESSIGTLFSRVHYTHVMQNFDVIDLKKWTTFRAGSYAGPAVGKCQEFRNLEFGQLFTHKSVLRGQPPNVNFTFELASLVMILCT